MPTAIRETALAAIVARLEDQIPTATVERARRAEVDIDADALPHLAVAGIGWEPDESVEPGIVHYTLTIAVTGIVSAETDLEAEQEATALHAQVVAALSGFTPGTAGLGDLAEADADFEAFAVGESEIPAGQFTARFTLLCLAPLGSPYAA